MSKLMANTRLNTNTFQRETRFLIDSILNSTREIFIQEQYLAIRFNNSIAVSNITSILLHKWIAYT